MCNVNTACAASVGAAMVASSSSSSEEDEVVKIVERTICQVIDSPHFNRKEIRERSLKLSEAYCLLWQDSRTGNVAGRQVSTEKQGGVVCALLLDLIILGKINVRIDNEKFLFVKYQNKYVTVKNASPTGTFLDVALFNKIAKTRKGGRERLLKYWIRDSLSSVVASVPLNSLVARGILTRKEKLLSTDYPLKNPEPKGQLHREIRNAALGKAKPDSFMRVLLTVLRAVDNSYSFEDPFLERHFTKEEYKTAKPNIKKIVIFNNP